MLFWFLIFFILFLSTLMINLNSPIWSILCLCTILVWTIILLFIEGVEFLSYIFIMIYVGGIALLFLFVVIMLNLKLDLVLLKKRFRFLSGPFLLFILVLKFQHFLHINLNIIYLKNVFILEEIYIKSQYFLVNDILNFGFLFTHYFIYLLIVGVILLVSMLGVLVIALNNNNVRK